MSINPQKLREFAYFLEQKKRVTGIMTADEEFARMRAEAAYGIVGMAVIMSEGGQMDHDTERRVLEYARKFNFDLGPGAGYSSGNYSSSSSNSDGCFIATAAYGSYHSPQVLELRTFRDRVLLQSRWGRSFVGVYYNVSPPIAKIVASSNVLRAIVRVVFLKHAVSLLRKLKLNGE